MSTNKVIQSIQKQNDSIYASLIARQIQFERTICPEGTSDPELLVLLNEENSRLKEVVKANKPAPQPKEEKIKPEQVSSTSKPKENIENKENKDDDDDETYEEPVKKFDTLTNMEDMKRAFFSGDYGIFGEQIRTHPFKLFKVQYKYDSDKDGSPEFSAKNLLKGFVRNFDDYRKYFMICFRCMKYQDELKVQYKYKYDSVWIVNTNEPIQNIIGSTWDDFVFEETVNIDEFIEQIKKIPETDEPICINGYTCIGESYVH
jgi:hypothetical protein